MATANFYTQKDFRLMAGEFCYPVYPIDENGEENTSSDPVDYETDFYGIDEAQAKIDEINKGLRFYKLRLQDGHYSGVQIVVDDDNAPDDYYLEKWFDFADYGVNRYVLRRMVQAEKRRINENLLPLFKEYGFDEYAISARFSNGETWYNKVA